jgi:hypothetical protein
MTSINQTIGINDNMIQQFDLLAVRFTEAPDYSMQGYIVVARCYIMVVQCCIVVV